eukprot:gene44223-6382_t
MAAGGLGRFFGDPGDGGPGDDLPKDRDVQSAVDAWIELPGNAGADVAPGATKQLQYFVYMWFRNHRPQDHVTEAVLSSTEGKKQVLEQLDLLLGAMTTTKSN